MTTYRVLIWDHDVEDWRVWHVGGPWTGLTLSQLKAAVKELYGCGWDRVSILVESELEYPRERLLLSVDSEQSQWAAAVDAPTQLSRPKRKGRGSK